jgi:hypothetical protein
MDDERLKNPDLPYDYFEELVKKRRVLKNNLLKVR